MAIFAGGLLDVTDVRSQSEGFRGSGARYRGFDFIRKNSNLNLLARVDGLAFAFEDQINEERKRLESEKLAQGRIEELLGGEQDFFFKQADVCSFFQARIPPGFVPIFSNPPFFPTGTSPLGKNFLISGCFSVVSGALSPIPLLPGGPDGQGQSGLREAVVNFFKFSLCTRRLADLDIRFRPEDDTEIDQDQACEFLGAL